MSRANAFRLGRWAGAALLSFGIAILITDGPLYPTPLGLLFLVAGFVGSVSCAWAYRRFRGSLNQGTDRTRLQDRWVALLLTVLFVVGCAAWAQRYDAWTVILKSGEAGSGVILSKRIRFVGRSARYRLSVRVNSASSLDPVAVEVSGKSYEETAVGEEIELSYVEEDGELMIASSDLSPRGLSLAHWAALFLALLGAGWTEVLSWVGKRRPGH